MLSGSGDISHSLYLTWLPILGDEILYRNRQEKNKNITPKLKWEQIN